LEKIIKKTKIIIKNKNKNKKINHVGKHCSNPQCFVRKAIVVFINQLNIKKKIDKDNFRKNHKKIIIIKTM